MKNKTRILKIMVGFALFCFAITSAASAAEQKPIVIGVAYPNVGMAAMYGKTAIDSINLAMEEINNAGGVLGRKLVMEFRDSQGDPEVCLRESKALVYEKDALIVMNGVGTSVCLPSVEFAGEQGKNENFLLVPHTIGDKVTEGSFNPYVFAPYQVTYATSYTMAQAAYETYHPKKILIMGADYSYSRDNSAAFKALYAKHDPNCKFTRDIYTPLNTSDFTPYISQIMASGADVVYNMLWGGDYAAWLKQAYAYGYYDKIHEVGTTAGLWSSVSHLKKGDPWPKKVLSGEYAPIWQVYSELGKGLNDRYYKKYGYYMGENATHSYSMIYIMANAIKRAGSLKVDEIIKELEDKVVEHALGYFKMRGYDHRMMMPFWAGTVEWPDDLPHPRVLNCWAPPRIDWEGKIIRSIPEIKAIREKANNPYATYLGN